MSGFIGTPTMQDIEYLQNQIHELAARIVKLENHGHPYAACYAPGGVWDKTTGPTEAKARNER